MDPSRSYTLTQSHDYGMRHTEGPKQVDSQSGSETDISTSTETLSPEERHALRHTRRQEPQGQEHVPPSLPGHVNNLITTSSSTSLVADDALLSSRNNDNSNMSMSSSTNTMIIHHSVADNSWSRRWTPSSYSTSTPTSIHRKTVEAATSKYVDQEPELPSYSSHLRKLNADSFCINSSLINTSMLESSLLSSNIYTSSLVPKTTSFLSESGLNASKMSDRQEAGVELKFLPESDLTDLQSSYLDQSEVLKHLITKDKKGGFSDDQSASSSNSGLNILSDGSGSVFGRDSNQPHTTNKQSDYSTLLNLPPPPSYSHWQRDQELTTTDTLLSDSITQTQLSRSQPDLTRLSGASRENCKDLINLRLSSDATDESERHLLEMIDVLTQENNSLKTDIHTYRRKVAKLQRFELEIIKVHEAHEALVKLSDHREQLERLARHKLNVEVKQLKEANIELKEQLDVLSNEITSCSFSTDSDSLRKEMNKRDVFIAQLVSQNKELIAAKERQEIELNAQKKTLNEQRTHIDILDNALTNAQTNVVKLEEEVRKKQNLVEQAGQLKRLLLSLQLSADRREHSEKNLRQKLEKEIMLLRSGMKQEGNESEISQLKRELREREEKIMVLEGEVTKWEQRYLQESAMRQLAIEAASMPKDAKIAALEKTSQESDRQIAQAKSDKLRHLDDIHNMSKKLSDSQSKNKYLESKIAEKDAMIKVLQKRVEEKENLYQTAVRSSVGSSPRGSACSTSDPGCVTTSTSHLHSSSVSGSSSGVFTTPGTPRKDEDLGYYVARVATRFYGATDACNPVTSLTAYPSSPLYSSASCLSTSLSVNSLPFSRKDAARPKTDSFCSSDEVSSRHSHPNKGEPSRFASQDLLDSDSYHDKCGLVCFPGLADQGFATGESQQSKSLLATVDRPHQRPPTPISVLSYPSAYCNKSLSYCECDGYDVCSLHNASCQVNQNMTTVALRPATVPATKPPPYHGHHNIVQNIQNECTFDQLYYNNNNMTTDSVCISKEQDTTPLFPNPLPLCRKSHLPNMTCNTCNIVRKSNRQNAAKMLRRANSSGCQRKKILSSAASNLSMVETSTFDSSSILAQLKREWKVGDSVGATIDTCSGGSNTLSASISNVSQESDNFTKVSEQPCTISLENNDIKNVVTHELSDIPANCCHINNKFTCEKRSFNEPIVTKPKHSAVSHLAHLKDLAAKLITQSGINTHKNNDEKLKEFNNSDANSVKTEDLNEFNKNTSLSPDKMGDKILNYTEADDGTNQEKSSDSQVNELIIIEDTDKLKLIQQKHAIDSLNNLI